MNRNYDDDLKIGHCVATNLLANFELIKHFVHGPGRRKVNSEHWQDKIFLNRCLREWSIGAIICNKECFIDIIVKIEKKP